MKLGIDQLLSQNTSRFKNARIGLLAHPASIDSEGIPTLIKLHEHPDFNLVKLFGPEHGLWGMAQDMESVDQEFDPLTKLPVKSLYGSTIDSIKPCVSDFENLDILICDLQDIGARYYTYIYTMAFCMEIAAKTQTKVIVLDRPNPIGNALEGNILDIKYRSFVGYYPILTRHGMTMGELASYFNTEENLNCDLEVISMKDWNRHSYYDENNLVWVAPSPNMPTIDTAILYPGLCLLEATEISEGRGTTRPFEWVGAPYIDPFLLAEKLNQLKLSGVFFRPIGFKPGFQKFQNQFCYGVQIHLLDRVNLQPLLIGVKIIETIYHLYPQDFKWREKPYEFVEEIPAIDLLWGNDSLRKSLESGVETSELIKNMDSDIKLFLKKRDPYLLYD